MRFPDEYFSLILLSGMNPGFSFKFKLLSVENYSTFEIKLQIGGKTYSPKLLGRRLSMMIFTRDVWDVGEGEKEEQKGGREEKTRRGEGGREEDIPRASTIAY